MSSAQATQTRGSSRAWPAFLLAGLGLCFLVFGSALLGRRLLAPVEIAPAQWKEYRHVDPETSGVPWNYHVVDQLGYDLPLQWTVHQAWRRGEIPWWDPFTYAGRPLLADAHVSGTDPVRVVCSLVLEDFVLAYNWTRALHFLIGGLGLFLLLRRLGCAAVPAGALAWTGAFAGCHTVYFGHPWVQAAAIYYPWLWLAWHGAWEGSRRARLVAPWWVAAALYAGNLQSHTYLGLFAAAFCVGYGWRSADGWRRALGIVVPAGMLGALLAAPMLGAELELFFLSARYLEPPQAAYRVWDGLFSLAAVWPWALGTFRTVTYWNLGFLGFVGSAGVVLAVAGLRGPALPGDPAGAARRMAMALVALVLAILSVPPVAQLLYARTAGLAVLGLVVLAAGAAQALAQSREAWPKLGGAVAGLALVCAAGSQTVASLVFPRVRPWLEQRLEARAALDLREGRSAAARRQQLANYPEEVGLGNPEVAAAVLGLLALAAVWARPGWRRVGLPVALGVNLASPVLFAGRFIPDVPRVAWERLLAGGPRQREAAAQLNPHFARLLDLPVLPVDGLFPYNTAHLQQVRVLHGYAALMPPMLAWTAPEEQRQAADWEYRDGTLAPLPHAGQARFRWGAGLERPVRIVAETLNTLELEIGDGPAGELVRTDTRYPGWEAHWAGGRIAQRPEGRSASVLEVPAGPGRLFLRYRPRPWRAGLLLAGCAALGLVAVTVRTRRLWAGAHTL